MSLVARSASEPATPPPSGVSYPQVLRGSDASAVQSLMGLALGLVGYGLAVPVVAQLVVAIGYAVRHPAGGFKPYYAAAMQFRYPEGLVAGHLGLATLIPVSLLLVRFVHHRPTAFLMSVQPGMRWRYLVIMGGVAAVVLNLAMWLPRIGTATVWNPQAHLWLWLLLIVLTSPFQAAAEEFFFRGYLMQCLGSMVENRWFGVVGSAFVFALCHGLGQNLPLFLDRFGFGLMAGTLVLVTGGLEAGIATHVVNNLFAFGYAALMGGVATARGVTTLTWGGAGIDLLGFAVCAAIGWLIGRRMNLATTTPAVVHTLPGARPNRAPQGRRR